MVGDDRQGGSAGPQRLVEAGAERLLTARGFAVDVERIERVGSFRDSVSASLAVNKSLASAVRRAVGEDRFPLILAGSCDVCVGILSGIDGPDHGVVSIDAHGDFNTPESTITGFFGGMSLAVITGHCYRNFWAQIGANTLRIVELLADSAAAGSRR